MRIFLTMLCLVAAPAALADVTLDYRDARGASAFLLLVKGQQMRMESGRDAVVLFDGRTRELTVLEPDKRRYLVLDPESLAGLQAQMKQVLAQAEQFGLSPDAMGLGGGGEPATEVRTDETRTVNGYPCRVYRFEVDGRLDASACVAEPAAVGVADDEWQVMHEMFGLLMQMADELLPDGLVDFEMAPPDGITVEAQGADGGDYTVLAAVEHAELDADRFAVPSGWQRMPLGR